MTAGAATAAPDAAFEVHLDNFDGPFDLLLGLIAKHKLDITEISLAKVTDDFIGYIKAKGVAWDLDETSEFLLVAATLLDLKAARLLPAARSRTTRTSPCWRPGTCCSPGCCSTARSRTSRPRSPAGSRTRRSGTPARCRSSRGSPRCCRSWSSGSPRSSSPGSRPRR